LPDVDQRLVAPETRYEIYDGELVHVAPADEPHGTRHSKVVALVEIHTGAAFDVACDMLTRTSETSDVAPDVSVFPRARDPRTGGRQLEQLAFEVVSTESLSHAGRKAAKLIARGVRRVFAIDVARVRALEWSAPLETWSMLDPGGVIEDPALAVPLSIHALVHAAETDDVVAHALLLKRNAVIEAARAQDRAEGKQEGRAETLIVMLDARGVVLGSADRERILGERDPSTLARWITRAATCTDIAEVFAET
jgi:Uma2 family endonuclease